jgi:hypothetical protein
MGEVSFDAAAKRGRREPTRSLLFLLFIVVAIATTLQVDAQTTAKTSGEPQAKSFQLAPDSPFSQIMAGRSVSALQDEYLVTLLDSIATEGFTVNGDTYWDFPQTAIPISVVPLHDQTDQTKIIFLYYLPQTQQHFFLQASRNPDQGNRVEVRVWSSDSSSELLVTEKDGPVATTPSKATARLRNLRGFSANSLSLSPADAITCLLQTLGVNLVTTNWSQLLGSIACSYTTTFGEVQTLLSCLSMGGIGLNDVTATVGCVTGIANLTSCGYVNCSALNRSPVATPSFSPSPYASYSGSVMVTITTATSGATIRYTLNGGDPTSSSAIYTGPLTLTSTSTLRAKAFKSGMTDSATSSAMYSVTQRPPLSAYCYAWPNPVSTYQWISWQAVGQGGSGSYSYNWLNGTMSTNYSKYYMSRGIVYNWVVVTDRVTGQSTKAYCSLSVQ